jgi:hypothetical protein
MSLENNLDRHQKKKEEQDVEQDMERKITRMMLTLDEAVAVSPTPVRLYLSL